MKRIFNAKIFVYQNFYLFSGEVEKYGSEQKMDLQLASNTLYGYHIQMPVPKRLTFKISDLPELFINVMKYKIFFF